MQRLKVPMSAQLASSRSAIPPATPCDVYLEELSRGKERVLLLDYDGTIAPFSAERDRAHPYPSVVELLDCIMSTCHTRVVLLSGRAALEVVPLFGQIPYPEIWGSHGVERLLPNGQYFVAEVSREARQSLAAAWQRLSDEGVSERAEQKPGAVALHWRGLNPTQIEAMKATGYRAFARLAGKRLLLSEFDGGMELRVRGHSKGGVVRAILAEHERQAAVAYLGDDNTDEDAFRALNGRGFTVLVRPTYRPTAAHWWMRPPGELIAFLEKWIEACEGEA